VGALQLEGVMVKLSIQAGGIDPALPSFFQTKTIFFTVPA